MWISDSDDDKIYAYKMSDKSRDPDKDFNILQNAGNSSPTGIWSDGTTMWTADTGTDKIYAYLLSDAPTLFKLDLTGQIPSNSPKYANFEIPLNPGLTSALLGIRFLFLMLPQTSRFQRRLFTLNLPW